MIDYYNNETRLTEILRAVVGSSEIHLGPARTREEIFVSRAFGLTMWPAIPPRTTMEMWLAFIAGDTAEPTAGSYTVRTCAESCVITYARRVRGASAVVPIFPPHTHYERALAKLAGIVPVDWGVMGREWEHLLQTITTSAMTRSAVTVIGGERVSVGPEVEINPVQAGSGAASPTNRRPIFPGLTIVRDDGSTLEVYGGVLDTATRTLTATWKKIALGDYDYNKSGGDDFYIRANAVTDFKTYGSSTSRYGRGISNTFNFLTDGWPNMNNTCTCYFNAGYNGYRVFIHSVEHKRDEPTTFRTWLQSIDAEFVYELATPITYQLTESELRRALTCAPTCAEYLGVGVWRLSCGSATIIHAQIHTESPINHYDIAASAEGWSFEITVDGVTVSGASGSITVAAGDHDVVITATPSAGAGVCIIQPTLYNTAAAGLLGSQDLGPEETVEPEEPEEPVEPEEPEEPAEPEPEEPVEPEPEEPEEPEPEEPAEPEPEEPVEPEPEEPEEPKTTKRRRAK